MTLADYARRVDKFRATVTQWKQAGKIVMQGRLVDVEASDAKLHTYRIGGMPAIVNPSPTVKRGRPVALNLKSAEPVELPWTTYNVRSLLSTATSNLIGLRSDSMNVPDRRLDA